MTPEASPSTTITSSTEPIQILAFNRTHAHQHTYPHKYPEAVSLDFEIIKCYEQLQANLTESNQRGWMQKKQHHPPYAWLTRWVIISEGHLLWSDRQITVGLNGLDGEEKRRWNKCIPISSIMEVSPITEGKTQRKFRIKVREYKSGKDKEIIWKSKDRKWRDRWVMDLRSMILQ